jgi:hypothetical protein
MAFVVEDGTGVANANSYATVEYFRAYFEERGNEVAAAIGDDLDIQKLLIRATDYIELVFGRYYIGDMYALSQSLSWPRMYASPYTNNVIPINLQKATVEYALRANDGPLLPDPSVDANGFASVVTKKVIGPIEKEFAVMGGGRGRLVRSYPVPDALMATLLRAGTAGKRVIR